MRQLYFKTRAAWRKWLALNHDKHAGVWLVFYKKHTGKASLDYEAAVEEALCFGWIDSIIKKLDDQRYVRKMTPRKLNSQWSDLNRRRVERVIRQGCMTESGLAKINAAKASGQWEQSGQAQISLDVPAELRQALAQQPQAKAFFDELAPSYRKQFIAWVAVAKQQTTRDRRVKEAIDLLAQGKKLGMK
jgi:uncharacterized protein YdeI (YjbR/CyaY-like superfamily)